MGRLSELPPAILTTTEIHRPLIPTRMDRERALPRHILTVMATRQQRIRTDMVRMWVRLQAIQTPSAILRRTSGAMIHLQRYGAGKL